MEAYRRAHSADRVKSSKLVAVNASLKSSAGKSRSRINEGKKLQGSYSRRGLDFRVPASSNIRIEFANAHVLWNATLFTGVRLTTTVTVRANFDFSTTPGKIIYSSGADLMNVYLIRIHVSLN